MNELEIKAAIYDLMVKGEAHQLEIRNIQLKINELNSQLKELTEGKK